jgi:hypothetical protein
MRRRLKNHPSGQAEPGCAPSGDPVGGAETRYSLGSDMPGSGKADRGHRSLFAVVCVLLGAVIVAVFWQVNHFEFVNCDDPEYFSANPHVLGGLTGDSVVWAFSTRFLGNWFPLT